MQVPQPGALDKHLNFSARSVYHEGLRPFLAHGRPHAKAASEGIVERFNSAIGRVTFDLTSLLISRDGRTL